MSELPSSSQPIVLLIGGKPVEFWLVPYFSDLGFKTAWVKCQLFPRRAIQELLGFQEEISTLTLIRNEITPLSPTSKGGIYDVICQDERKRVFIIEMQAGAHKPLKKRLLFYLFQQYCSMIPKDEKKRQSFMDVPELYCICIVKGRLLEGKNYHNDFMFRNKAGKAFDQDVQLHLFELGKFPILRHQPQKAKTPLQKLLFTMKYAHTFKPEERPAFMQEHWLSDSIEELEVTKLDPQQRAFLEMELAKEAEIRESREIELEEEKAKAAAKGKMEEKIESILHQNSLGLDVEFIAKISRLTVEQVEKILKKHSRQPNRPGSNGKKLNGKN